MSGPDGVFGRALYPNCYAWFVFFASLDVMFTRMVLYLGGVEVNGVADAVIQSHGLLGMIALKFVAVVVVLAICQWIGQQNWKLGRRVVWLGVGLNVLPVAVAIAQLLNHSMRLMQEMVV